jgi:hypothetical protein
MESENIDYMSIKQLNYEEALKMYSGMGTKELAMMIMANTTVLSPVTLAELLKLPELLQGMSTTMLAEIMTRIHMHRFSIPSEVKQENYTTGSFTYIDPTYSVPLPQGVLQNPQEPSVIDYIPYQTCPKCQGQGVVPYLPGWPIIPGCEIPQSDLSYTCDVCKGQKIIPMCVKHDATISIPSDEKAV